MAAPPQEPRGRHKPRHPWVTDTRMCPSPRMGESWGRQAEDVCCVTPLTCQSRPVVAAAGTPAQQRALREPPTCTLQTRASSFSNAVRRTRRRMAPGALGTSHHVIRAGLRATSPTTDAQVGVKGTSLPAGGGRGAWGLEKACVDPCLHPDPPACPPARRPAALLVRVSWHLRGCGHHRLAAKSPRYERGARSRPRQAVPASSKEVLPARADRAS